MRALVTRKDSLGGEEGDKAPHQGPFLASGGTAGRVLSGGSFLPVQLGACASMVGTRVGLSPTHTSPASVGEQFCGLWGEGRQKAAVDSQRQGPGLLSALQRRPATLVLSAQVDKCWITSAEAPDSTAGIWGWQGPEWLSWGLGMACGRHHAVSSWNSPSFTSESSNALKKGQERTMWPQACTPCFCCDTGPSAAWGSSQGAQGSKAQVGSVSFMPLGATVWTLKQH